jgi:hypothetical protein
MDDLGFILLSYLAAFGSTAALAWWVVRRGRSLGRDVPDDEKTWV